MYFNSRKMEEYLDKLENSQNIPIDIVKSIMVTLLISNILIKSLSSSGFMCKNYEFLDSY